MSYKLPNGSTINIEATTGSTIAISGISNANPAVATTTAPHGLTQGQFVRVTSGWSRLSGKLVRVGVVADPTHFTLDGYDTSSVTTYPTGAGAGSANQVLTFVQVPQITGVASDGGDQNFATIQFLEADSETRIPTVRAAQGLTLTVADDPLQPAFPILVAASDTRTQRGIRINLPDGSLILYYGYVSVNKTPTFTVNEVMTYQVTLALSNEPVRYAS